MEAIMSKALRRHHRYRLMQKRKNYHGGFKADDSSKYAFYVDTPCPCSCDMCGNWRRSGFNKGERLTLQERKFLADDGE